MIPSQAVKRSLVLVFSLASLGSCASAEKYRVVDELDLKDRISFKVVDSQSVPVPKAEIFLIGPDWGRREDYVGSDGRWSIARDWLAGVRLILFCWPDGAFECASFIPSRFPASQVAVTITMPEPQFRHRQLLVPPDE